jgi:hypothetical protein
LIWPVLDRTRFTCSLQASPSTQSAASAHIHKGDRSALCRTSTVTLSVSCPTRWVFSTA